MGQAAALSNAHFTESGLYRALNGRSGFRLGAGGWYYHDYEFYAERIAAGADACMTAGLQTGATGRRLYPKSRL